MSLHLLKLLYSDDRTEADAEPHAQLCPHPRHTMASPPIVTDEKAYLLSLVAQSKHALQEGEALCSRANTLSNASAQDAFDVLALNTKIRWISDAVLEQLKVNAYSYGRYKVS